MSKPADDSSGADSAVETVVIGSELPEVSHAIEAFEAFASRRGLEPRVVQRTGVVLDELLGNVLSHGMATESLAVEVELRHETGRLVVRITDNSAPFNPLERAAPDTTASVEEREIGGLGIHLVRSMFDELSYERTSGRNVLSIVLRLDVAMDSR